LKELSNEMNQVRLKLELYEGESTTSKKRQVPIMEVKSMKGKNKISKKDRKKIKIKKYKEHNEEANVEVSETIVEKEIQHKLEKCKTLDVGVGNGENLEK